MTYSSFEQRRLSTAVTLLVLIAGTMNCRLEAADSDVLTTVFGGGILSENADAVSRKAALLDPPERYRVLLDFVLPAGSERLLRTPVKFSVMNSRMTGETRGKNAASRVETGGQIESPVLDLVAVALQLDQLDELRSQVEESADVSTSNRIARLSSLVIIHCAAGETGVASRHLAELYTMVAADRELSKESEDALLLAIHTGAKQAETRTAANDLAYDLHQTHLDQVQPNEWRPFHRHVAALIAQIADQVPSATGAPSTARNVPTTEFSQWQRGSLFTAESRGTGCPPNVWSRDATGVRKASGHSIDLLYFQSPLQGDFDVECDASVFNWRSIHPTFGGHWAGVEPERMQRRIGTLAELDSTLDPLAARLTKFRHEIHYRISVRGQQMEVYGNGRLLNSVLLNKDHDPWVALRRSAKHSARIWNVRITGEPNIPDEIRLSESPTLTGWIPYFNEGVGGTEARNTDWQQVGNLRDGGIIAGHHQPELPRGAHAERLLYYHRPMLEDGSIEYEFFYKAGESCVHPAIDRAAFILAPDGIKLHWVTDGVFDRSDLSPENETDEPVHRRGPAELPLQENQWNRIRVELSGDTIRLFLNGEHIYERPLEASNQRNFGLFHDADQSQAVVRNVVWRGDWPKELPLLYDQELAGEDTRLLDQSAMELASRFRHSFKTDPFPLGKFVVSAGKMVDTKPGIEGLSVQSQGSSGYQRTVLAAQLAVEGDFDISASFDSLVTRPGVGGHSSLSISVLLADQAATQTSYRRRHNRHPGGREDQHLAYADVASSPRNGARRSNIGYEPAESNSGTLRVARRGGRLYTLFAEGDSQNFRITGESEFPKDDVLLGGILLSGMVYAESFVSFRWTNLEIRADRITGPAVEATDLKEILADLNQKRDRLPVAGDFDFAKNAPADEEFFRWGSVLPWSSELGGQLMIHQGRPTWASSGITPRNMIDGDFDVTAVFEVQKIVNPTAGVRSTIYLKTSFGPSGDTQASLMFDINPKDERQVFVRLGTRKQDGGYSYKVVGGIAASEITVLRFARYGTTMYFLARRDIDSPEQLIATKQVSDEPISGRTLNFMVHSGGEGRETHVLLKSLKVRAEKSTPADLPIRPGPIPAGNTPPKSKGFFDSVIDFFK
ncbi:MAG: DUF1583 domain-containing protein [Rhodopirellula sp.]|nr:DUF1583 domain-containing protein [Rhodopirellula sp.]